MRLTCDVGVMVALQPGLHADKIIFIHKEYDVFSPIDLICRTSTTNSTRTHFNIRDDIKTLRVMACVAVCLFLQWTVYFFQSKAIMDNQDSLRKY